MFLQSVRKNLFIRISFIEQIAIFFSLLAICFNTQAADISKDSPDSTIKNVLFIISDDLKASVLGSYGDPICKTPNIDQLAKEGMLFTRAYAQGPLCKPSRPSMMFSRYMMRRIDDSKHKSFPQVLKEQGWYSARVGKIFHMGVSADIVRGSDGLDYPASWSERFNCSGLEYKTPGVYEALNINVFEDDLETFEKEIDAKAIKGIKTRTYIGVKAHKADGSDQPDYKAADKAIELLQAHQEEPFVLAVGFVRPHSPEVAPKAYFDQYPWEDITLPEQHENDWDDIPAGGISRDNSMNNGIDRYPDNQKRMWQHYYAAVSFMDAQVGRVMNELERLGLRDSTLVIFTSDHGYHLGEHGFWKKSNLHEESQRVPLIISAPGLKPGVCDSLTELVDLYPTILDFMNVETPSYCEGISLKPLLNEPTKSIRDYALSYQIIPNDNIERFALRANDWAYMVYENGEEELYDMQRDPKQFTNLANHPDHQKMLKKFRLALVNKHQKMQGR